MFPIFLIILFGSKGLFFWLYIFFQMLATIFVTVWDFFMDWGLFRSTKKSTPYLRNLLTFEPRFYYKCMLLNLILRHFWLIPLILNPHFNQRLSCFQPLIFASMLAEMVRRTIWSVIRVENESLNNFEEYRSINTIPPIKEDCVND